MNEKPPYQKQEFMHEENRKVVWVNFEKLKEKGRFQKHPSIKMKLPIIGLKLRKYFCNVEQKTKQIMYYIIKMESNNYGSTKVINVIC